MIAEAVRTTLGPRGMDKLLVDGRGEERGLNSICITRLIGLKLSNQKCLCFPGKATISNDGATILKLLDVVHPAAKTLVDIARSQDAEVRSVCVFKD